MRILIARCPGIGMVFWRLSAFAGDEDPESPLKVGGLLFGDAYFIPSPKGNNISNLPMDPSARATIFFHWY